MVITPLTFRSERCYFMKSGSERCYSGFSRTKFLGVRGVIVPVCSGVIVPTVSGVITTPPVTSTLNQVVNFLSSKFLIPSLKRITQKFGEAS